MGNPPNFLLTAHALYVYKFNLVEISLDTFEKTVLVESVQDHTGEAEWMNLDFVYDDTFYFSVECNGICNTDNCYMLTPIKTGYLCFAPDVEACPDTFRLLSDENDKEGKKGNADIHEYIIRSKGGVNIGGYTYLSLFLKYRKASRAVSTDLTMTSLQLMKSGKTVKIRIQSSIYCFPTWHIKILTMSRGSISKILRMICIRATAPPIIAFKT